MNSKDLLYIGIYGSFYFMIIIGLWLVFANPITYLLKKEYYSRFRIKKKSWLVSQRWFQYLERLIEITCGKGSKYISVYSFVIFSLSLAVIFLILLIKQTSIPYAFTISALFGLLPYLYLRIKLSSIRIEGSYEVDVVVSELLNQYKMNYSNMIEAIDAMVFLEEAPICRKAFYRLSLKLKVYRTGEELITALEEVAFTVDTYWMKMLINNFYMAIERDINVITGLEDILYELRETKSIAEKSKQINNEGVSILKYLSPVMYGATVFIAIKYFGFSVSKFIQYQFYTTIGLKFFVLILLLMAINMIIMMVFQKRKFDF